jgi:hypothetical protein
MKIQKIVLSTLFLACLPVSANVIDVSFTGVGADGIGYLIGRDENLAFFLTAQSSSGAGLTTFQPKEFTTTEDLILQWQDSGYSALNIPGLNINQLLQSYPSAPESEEGIAAYVDAFSELPLDDQTYKLNVDKLILDEFDNIGIPLKEVDFFTFYGASNTHQYFIDLTSKSITTLYRCDKELVNPSIRIDEQPEACPILDAGIGYQFLSLGVHTVTSDDRVIVSDNETGTHKVYSRDLLGNNIGFSAEPGDLAALTEEMPLNAIFLEESGRSGLFSSTLPPKKIYTNQTFSRNATLQFNDTYYAYVENPYRGETTLRVCEYEIVSPQTNPFTGSTEDGHFLCENGINNEEEILRDNLMIRGDVEKGFLPNFALSPDTRIATAYYASYRTMFATPVIIDIETGEETYLSRDMKSALIDKFSNEFMVAVENAVLEILDDDLKISYQNFSESPLPDGLRADITEDQYISSITEIMNRFALQPGVYEEFLETDAISETRIRRNTTVGGEAAVWQGKVFQFIGSSTLQTPFGTFEFESDEPLSVEGAVKLPGTVVPEGGIEVTLIGDQGDRHELISDANGVFSITDPTSDNYEITFSYPNHVFECANVDLSSGTFGEFEMLAGDVNDDGEISSADQWIFYLRAFYPSTDFDLNNDGVVNNTDRNIISTNRGAVQCDL